MAEKMIEVYDGALHRFPYFMYENNAPNVWERDGRLEIFNEDNDPIAIFNSGCWGRYKIIEVEDATGNTAEDSGSGED